MPPKAVTHRCGRCGKRLKAGGYVYSRFSRERYCTDITACAARAKKRK